MLPRSDGSRMVTESAASSMERSLNSYNQLHPIKMTSTRTILISCDCIMSPHPKAKSQNGYSHWSEEQRNQACSFFKSAFKRHHVDIQHSRGRSPTLADLRKRKRGCTGDLVWTEAWAGFQAAQRSCEHRRMTNRHQMQAVVRSWLPNFMAGERLRRSGRNSGCPLSEKEVQFAVQTLSTPIEDGDNLVYFQTVAQCIADSENGDRLQAILTRKCVSPQALHRMLVDDLKVVAFKRCDIREELAPSTLAQRRKCSEIWGRRRCWLEHPSPTRSAPAIQVFFQWDWFFEFTFMIDAISFENGVLSCRSNSPKVYQAIHASFGPQLQQRKKSVATTSKMMFYVMIHRHGGIVAGPSLVLSGSRVPQAQASQKGAILAPWCDPT